MAFSAARWATRQFSARHESWQRDGTVARMQDGIKIPLTGSVRRRPHRLFLSGLWPGLVRFLGDPKILLNSQSVEHARRRRRTEEPLRHSVGTRRPDSGALLLAHRAGGAVRGRAARLPAGSHAARCPESRHSDALPRPQVTEIRREIDAGQAARGKPILAEDLAIGHTG